MGLFYSNMTVAHADPPALTKALRRLRRDAFLSPPDASPHVAIFDREMEDQDAVAIEDFGCQLTASLRGDAWAAALHDDAVLYLWLFRDGEVWDRYDSMPEYFDPNPKRTSPPAGGNPAAICDAFGRPAAVERVGRLLWADLLHGDLPEIRGEQERHAALAAELSLPLCVAGVCYSSIAGGYVPKPFNTIRFERV